MNNDRQIFKVESKPLPEPGKKISEDINKLFIFDYEQEKQYMDQEGKKAYCEKWAF